MTTTELIERVDYSFELALEVRSKLDAETLAIKGFSTPTMRHFFNNLCSSPVAHYLEVGAWFGASACAAMFGNKQLRTTIVEDFSQDFSEIKARDHLMASIERVRPTTGTTDLIERDAFTVPMDKFVANPVDVFFYDGRHDYEPQRKAIPYFLSALNSPCAIVVDDFNWPDVERGTRDGIKDVAGQLRLEKKWVIHTPTQDDPVWHNGLFVGVFVKP